MPFQAMVIMNKRGKQDEEKIIRYDHSNDGNVCNHLCWMLFFAGSESEMMEE
jgi:hypothetical protein